MNRLTQLKLSLKACVQQSPLWGRWLQLSPNDRTALSLLGVFLLPVLFYLLVWRPLDARVERAKAYQALQQETFLYIQRNAALARASAVPGRAELAPEQLQGTITGTAKQQGLVLERIDSDGAGLLVTVAEVPFDAMLRWLVDLDAKGISVSEISLDRGTVGKVDARLTLVLMEGGR
ncbi:type II secretion system protein M [Phytopseudomonas dryadis]|uniref:Type II secretion system protein M n=1 Tax=Phytopseudomonas dryadis TaxID=2487520 RepID=A0ABY1YZL5_9GAMM|nr:MULTISPECIES: type II secretion system protein M [Pseudomonas]TBU99713.1 type II secretion system protein M [Pseudomonas dryadis]TBV12676.1 type II secretion system protein M [Pseudomonas sp. FRB 230]